MKIIIAGDGKVGSTLARELSVEGYDVTLIDANQSVLENTMEQYDIMTVHGNCAAMAVLKQAGVAEADLLIAATNADEINLLCCMTAHGIAPGLHTIARIRNPEYYEQIYSMKDIFGLSMTINPERQASAEIERLLKYPGFLKRDTFAKGRVEIVELRVNRTSKLCDLTLSDMDSIVKCKVLVCAVLRGGKTVAPDGNFVLRENDRIFVTAPANNLTKLLKNLGIITHKVKRIMICGGGRISYYLAERLQRSGIEVLLIEQDRERCIWLAERLPSVSIVQGDASNQFLLEKEGIHNCDALVAMTGLDELNMIISIYGSSCGVSQTITKMSRVENSNILNTVALGSIICPKELCSNTIVQYVRAMKNQTGAAISVHSIADGQAEAMEFLVDDTVKYCGVPLKNVKLRPNTLLVCISHGAKTEIPDGNSVFYRGDTVVIVSSGDTVIYQLNDIFE